MRIFSFLLSIIILSSFSSDKPAYRLFDKTGEKASYAALLKEAQDADIVFFGELHNNPICHWLQKELTADIHAFKGKDLVLGAEMFEADNQLIIDEYLSGLISVSKFEDEVRLWPNYKTDYKPLMSFAKDSGLYFVATNVPRRYASVVHKSGGLSALDKLSEEAKSFLPPLPIKYGEKEKVVYEKMFSFTRAGGMKMKKKKMSKKTEAPVNMMQGKAHAKKMPDFSSIAQAQALKDASMAYFISKNYVEGKTFIHYNGSMHSDNFSGIILYLNKYKPNLKIVTITTCLQDNLSQLESEYKNKADFVICIDENMTTTY